MTWCPINAPPQNRSISYRFATIHFGADDRRQTPRRWQYMTFTPHVVMSNNKRVCMRGLVMLKQFHDEKNPSPEAKFFVCHVSKLTIQYDGPPNGQ